MRLNYKTLIILSCILYPIQVMAADHGMAGFEQNVIDASKNARQHSNMGNIYFDEKNYTAALKEYEIAYNLTYNNSASATYAYNIARAAMALGNYEMAKNALLGAIERNCINITYYETLVDCYIKLGIQEQELEKHLKDDTNPYNKVIAGLIFLKTGEKMKAKAVFDEFSALNPNMIITSDIKTILKKL